MSDGIYESILETMAKPTMDRRTFLKVGTIAVAAVVFPGCLKSGSSTPEIADYLTGDAVVDKYMFPLVDEAIKNGNNAALANYKELGTNLKKQAGEIRSQYSVPVTIVIADGFSGNPTAWLKPDKVDWDATHTNLLYDLTKPQEATLAIVEAIHNDDLKAMELLISDEMKTSIIKDGSSIEKEFEDLRKIQPQATSGNPYKFKIMVDEGNKIEVEALTSQKDSVYTLYRQSNGTWKL